VARLWQGNPVAGGGIAHDVEAGPRRPRDTRAAQEEEPVAGVEQLHPRTTRRQEGERRVDSGRRRRAQTGKAGPVGAIMGTVSVVEEA